MPNTRRKLGIMKISIKQGEQNTYHRDGTISHWDVYRQAWRRIPAADIEDRVLASMNTAERAKITHMIEKG